MSITELATTPPVHEITLDADGITLSGLLSQPWASPPHATVVALHGGGMRAGYFHGRADPRLSLLVLGAELGYTVLAVDRPGYGLSAHQLPEGQTLAQQAKTLRAALSEFARRHLIGDGFFVVAHSYGGKVALATAADKGGDPLLGLDISGCGYRYAIDPHRVFHSSEKGAWRLHWGPSRLYPPNTFRLARPLLAPMPERELPAVTEWPVQLPSIAGDVRVPTRFTFADHELWWRNDHEAVTELMGLFPVQPVVVEHQPNAGHNISLGLAARPYHLRALAFAEECVQRRDAATSKNAASLLCGSASYANDMDGMTHVHACNR